MKILVAEDEERLRKNIVRMIQKEHHSVDAACNGEEALDYALAEDYDLVILDWMMPKCSGIEVCRALRKKGYRSGILMLTARDATEDVIEGLDSGADDYLVKPFKMEELLARVRALLRRADKPLHQLLTVGDLSLNLDSRVLLRNEIEIELTKKEFLLLEYLFVNKGRVLTREQLFIHLWGYDEEVSNNALDALVKLVRKKIDRPSQPSIIQNIRGVGYKLRDVDV